MWRVLEEARRRLVGDRRAAMMAGFTVYEADCMCRSIPLRDAEMYRSLMLVEGEAEVENNGGDDEGKETAIGSEGKCANV